MKNGVEFMNKVDTAILIKNGMKEALLAKLGNKELKMLVSYAMDNTSVPSLAKSLVSLASMEIQGKEGAISLASHDLATPAQLKELSARQIVELASDYEMHHDERLIVKNIKEMLIIQQQEKLFTKTDGAKGEYFIDPRSKEDLEDEYTPLI
ncbi:MAG: hypothetical protein K0R73_1123 [Candidatus Midichloriaceae bacterium]|nr:hypothetical protein [Candidatus Midichloriaceae bacterium]